jgi:hypothetical protein
VSGFAISPDDMVQLHSFVARHGTAFLETVDDWLAQRSRERQRVQLDRSALVRPYLGLYLGTDSDSAQLAPQIGRTNVKPKNGLARRRRAKKA